VTLSSEPYRRVTVIIKSRGNEHGRTLHILGVAGPSHLPSMRRTGPLILLSSNPLYVRSPVLTGRSCPMCWQLFTSVSCFGGKRCRTAEKKERDYKGHRIQSFIRYCGSFPSLSPPSRSCILFILSSCIFVPAFLDQFYTFLHVALQGNRIRGEYRSACAVHPAIRNRNREESAEIRGNFCRWAVESFSDSACVERSEGACFLR